MLILRLNVKANITVNAMAEDKASADTKATNNARLKTIQRPLKLKLMQKYDAIVYIKVNVKTTPRINYKEYGNSYKIYIPRLRLGTDKRYG